HLLLAFIEPLTDLEHQRFTEIATIQGVSKDTPKLNRFRKPEPSQLFGNIIHIEPDCAPSPFEQLVREPHVGPGTNRHQLTLVGEANRGRLDGDGPMARIHRRQCQRDRGAWHGTQDADSHFNLYATVTFPTLDNERVSRE